MPDWIFGKKLWKRIKSEVFFIATSTTYFFCRTEWSLTKQHSTAQAPHRTAPQNNTSIVHKLLKIEGQF
jgi:hypothetical protein